MASMTQDEIDQRIAAIGGPQAVHSAKSGTVQVPNPAYNKYDPNSQEKIDVDVEQWKSPQGYILQAAHLPDGSWQIVRDESPTPTAGQAGVTGSNPRVPAGSVPRIEGTPTGKDAQGNTTYDNDQPIRAWHNPDGSVTYEPLQPNEVLDWERKKNGGLTNEEVRKQQIQHQQPASKREPVKDRPGYSIVTSADPNNPNAISTHYEKDDAPGVAVQLPGDSKNENVTYRKNAAGQLEKVTTTTVNGQKSETVTPVLPSERTQVGTKTTTANGKTVKITTWQLPDGSQIETTDEASDSANAPLPKGAPQFTPDPTDPIGDMGLTAYNHALHDAEAAGIIDHTQATRLLAEATPIASAAYSHQRDQQAQASTDRSQDITQRGQTLGETQSRRSAADTGFDNAQTTYIGGAAHLGAGHGGIAADAFREALGLRQAYAAQAGGYANSPEVPLSPAVAAMRTTTVHPDGKVVHATPVFAPTADPNGAPVQPGAAASGGGSVSAQSVAAPAATPAAAPDMRNSSDMNLPPGTPAAAPPATVPTPSAIPPADEYGRSAPYPTVVQPDASATATPDYGQPNMTVRPDPNAAPLLGPAAPPPEPAFGSNDLTMVPSYLQPVRTQAAPAFDPMSVVAELRQRGLSDAAIAEALQQHQAENGMAA